MSRTTFLLQADPTIPRHHPRYQAQLSEQYRSLRQRQGARRGGDRLIESSRRQRYRRSRRRRPTVATMHLRRAMVVAGVMSFLCGISYALTFQKATPLVQSHSSPFVPSLPSPNLEAEAQELFAHSNSIGAIALGVAEGTRTPEGERTPRWNSHIDAGNGEINQGTFAWQMEAASPETADQAALRYIQREAIPHILQDAEREGITVEPEVVVQAVDLWNQAPQAGTNFVENLKQCQRSGQQENVLLCARIRSYYNPTTGALEASGFDNDPALLEQDQRRRFSTIEQVLRDK